MIKIAKAKARAFLAFASRAPIKTPESQRIAIETYDTIKDLLTPEENARLMASWTEAAKTAEGKNNFKSVVKNIMKRIWV